MTKEPGNSDEQKKKKKKNRKEKKKKKKKKNIKNIKKTDAPVTVEFNSESHIT